MNIKINTHNKISFNSKLKIVPAKTNLVNLVDISSRAEYPINILSNFAPTRFSLDGVEIGSMEGFLQSLKVRDISEQRRICLMDGHDAKGIGKKMNRRHLFNPNLLHWDGKTYNRHSAEYLELLNRAYQARFDADADFRFALEYTLDKTLAHSIGGKSPYITILTEQEFVNILCGLRNQLKH